MAALAKDTLREWRDGHVVQAVVAASSTVYVGSIVQWDATGKVKPATGAANLKIAGVAETGGEAGEKVSIRRGVAFRFAAKSGDTIDAGDVVYAETDNEVTTTNSGRTKLGRVVSEESDGTLWVTVGID